MAIFSQIMQTIEMQNLPRGEARVPIAPLDLSLDLEASSCTFCDAMKKPFKENTKNNFVRLKKKRAGLNISKIVNLKCQERSKGPLIII